ncbi:MAG: O-antigen ligase family protein [Bacteroidota bacterium]
MSLAPYFFYTISVFFLGVTSCIAMVQKPSKVVIPFPAPLLLLIFLSAYFLINSLFKEQPISGRHFIIIGGCVELISFCFLFKIFGINPEKIRIAVITLIIIESVVCVLQYLKFLSSLNIYFEVTGTWSNPNVTAMFLAMSSPVLFSLFSTPGKMNRGVFLLTTFLMTVSLLLLKCRTAYIGFGISMILAMYSQFKPVIRLSMYQRLKRNIILITTLVIAIALLLSIFQQKKASTESRIFILKISSRMFLDNPWTGIGMGRFEHDYNLQQAKYFQNKNPTADEINNAGYVMSPYNEFLELCIEGGLPALAILIVFVVVLVRFIIVQKVDPSYSSGLVVFGIMSLCNFSIEAIPAFAIFVLYLSLVCLENPIQLSSKWNLALPRFAFSKTKAQTTCLVMAVIFFYQLFRQLNLAKAFYQNTIISELNKNKQYIESLNRMTILDETLSNNRDFLFNYAKAYIGTNQLSLATIKLKNATLLYSDPRLYIALGKCYNRQNELKAAEESFLLAKYIQPNLLVPNLELAYNSLRQHDTVSAVLFAQNVIAQHVKNPTEESEIIKNESKKFLHDVLNHKINY